MKDPVNMVERAPTAAEYLDLIEAVGWRPRERRAVEVALRNSLYAVCAEREGRVVGCGRVIGDGGLHLYLTDVVVVPAHQRRGVGTRIVAALTGYVESLPYSNTLVAVLPTPGLAGFYAAHGYKTQGPESPVMQRWINPSAEQRWQAALPDDVRRRARQAGGQPGTMGQGE
jgi:GNAT superfamily N-acetyltransferase